MVGAGKLWVDVRTCRHGLRVQFPHLHAVEIHVVRMHISEPRPAAIGDAVIMFERAALASHRHAFRFDDGECDRVHTAATRTCCGDRRGRGCLAGRKRNTALRTAVRGDRAAGIDRPCCRIARDGDSNLFAHSYFRPRPICRRRLERQRRDRARRMTFFLGSFDRLFRCRRLAWLRRCFSFSLPHLRYLVPDFLMFVPSISLP